MSDVAQVGIIMGSQSDLEVMKKAEEVLDSFDVSYTTLVSSAHRNPGGTAEFARTAEEKGFQVLICGAGMAAHLAGVVAAHTILPVIGVPLSSGALHGLDSLYSTVQMPTGVPVATVAVGGSKNAALLAVQILSRQDKKLRDKFHAFKQQLSNGKGKNQS